MKNNTNVDYCKKKIKYSEKLKDWIEIKSEVFKQYTRLLLKRNK